jgi:hypothetical protein
MSDLPKPDVSLIQSTDVFVDAAGLVYPTDYDGGLHILEYGG